jgi:hypothetical protein
MAAPTATPEDLNDRADLSLIKRSDRHCLRGRREGQAGASDADSPSPGISPSPALAGLASLKARRPQAQSFAAGGAERNQDSER